MTEQELTGDKSQLSRWEQHRFMLLIAVTIAISLFLVSVALALYASSGTAQLDLSRPGYVSVREQASRSDAFDSFPATGSIDKEALSKFRELYDKQAERATNVDGFSGDVLSDQVLSLDAPATEPVQ
jgi:hypothetical protein